MKIDYNSLLQNSKDVKMLNYVKYEIISFLKRSSKVELCIMAVSHIALGYALKTLLIAINFIK